MPQTTRLVKRTYYGWIVILREEGYRDKFFAEYDEGDVRKRQPSDVSPAAIVDWWDSRVGKHVLLEPTPIGYRVYTEETTLTLLPTDKETTDASDRST